MKIESRGQLQMERNRRPSSPYRTDERAVTKRESSRRPPSPHRIKYGVIGGSCERERDRRPSQTRPPARPPARPVRIVPTASTSPVSDFPPSRRADFHAAGALRADTSPLPAPAQGIQAQELGGKRKGRGRRSVGRVHQILEVSHTALASTVSSAMDGGQGRLERRTAEPYT